MAKAKRPVSINGIEFDALISSEFTMEATVPQYAVETGFTVSDTIILNSETLSLVLFLTDYPVTWKNRSGHRRGHLKSVVKKLQSLYYARDTITVRTSDKTYSNMAIESIAFNKSTEIGYAMEVPISLRQIRKTSASTSTIPAEYGKSGATQAAAGAASTSSGATGGGAGAADASGASAVTGTRKNSGGGDDSGGGASILFSAGKSVGLFKDSGLTKKG